MINVINKWNEVFLIFPMLGFKIKTIFNYKSANIFGPFENILKAFLPLTIISNAAKFTQPMQKSWGQKWNIKLQLYEGILFHPKSDFEVKFQKSE